jgi:hypothetical protein
MVLPTLADFFAKQEQYHVYPPGIPEKRPRSAYNPAGVPTEAFDETTNLRESV